MALNCLHSLPISQGSGWFPVKGGGGFALLSLTTTASRVIPSHTKEELKGPDQRKPPSDWILPLIREAIERGALTGYHNFVTTYGKSSLVYQKKYSKDGPYSVPYPHCKPSIVRLPYMLLEAPRRYP